MNAVIFSTGLDELFPLTKVRLKSMLPILNRPLMEHLIEHQQQQGIQNFKIVLHKFPEQVDSYFGEGEKLNINISYSLERQINGTFKCLRKFHSFLKEPFLFCNCNSFNKIDYAALFNQHRKSGAMITMAVAELNPLKNFQSVELADDGNLISIQNIEQTEPEKKAWLNTQLYIISPEITSYLKKTELCDIEHDLIPRLIQDGKKISTYKVHSLWEPISQLSYYWRLNINLMQKDQLTDQGKEIAPNVFAGKNVSIKTSLRNLKGPIIIGDNVKIKRNVVINGPAIIGHDVEVEKDATILESVVCDRSSIGKNIEVRKAVVDKGWHISVPNLFATYIEESHILGEVHRATFETDFNKFLIRLFDSSVALLGLIALSPLFLLLAIIIKLDSRGSVFYVSERLKRPQSLSKDAGHYQYLKKESVKYYVFRTMYEDADQRIKNINTKNKYESGPYKKFDEDPRVTRVGKFIRKVSLDEMPLLINVLKGDMSLVGIWALPTYEAEYLETQGLQAGELDLSDMARMRFQGKLGLAGYWQARGRSNLSAEERAMHDSFQSVFATAGKELNGRLGEYAEMVSFKSHIKILIETFMSVIKCRGAQ